MDDDDVTVLEAGTIRRVYLDREGQVVSMVVELDAPIGEATYVATSGEGWFVPHDS